MVMIPGREIEAMLTTVPDRGSAAYRNAWATVQSRIKSASKPGTIERLRRLEVALRAIGEPLPAPPRIPQTEALARGREANKARAIGRCRAAILRRVETSRWGVASVSTEKPFMWEAALQMVEDGELAFQRFRPIGGQGPQLADGREKGTRIWLMRPYMGRGTPCPFQSARSKAREERI
jgi:hypothetical protein